MLKIKPGKRTLLTRTPFNLIDNLYKNLWKREILLNRQEFLEQEKMAVSAELSNSKSKNDVLEKKGLKEKIAGAAKKRKQDG